MKKLSLYIFLVLVFFNFTNIVNAKVDGEGELYLSEGVVKKFIKYIRIDQDRKPDIFYITLDGTGFRYYWCKKNQNCKANSSLDIKDCEKKNFKKKCKRFAKGRTIKWKNGINPGKGKISKINKKWSDAQIYEKLVELGFINKNKNAKKKITQKYVYKNALRRFNSNGDYRFRFEPFNLKDPTTFKNIMFKEKKTFKKRHKKYSGDVLKTFRSFKFLAEFEDNITLEIFIEYNKSKENFEESEEIALFYSKIFGRIPHFLKNHVKKIYIFNSGGNWWVNKDAPNSINISKSNCTNKSNIIKGSYTLCNENMIHEAMHLFDFNRKLFSESKWLEATELDKDSYCSKYGLIQITEDFADSVLCWIGVRYKSNKIMKEDVVKINKYIPNRLKFFDDLNLNMYPYKISN
tara:strand:- start:73 stop:1287 length:1215 start_codon:yes stop_codon:yes gene_type:complete